MIRWNVTKLLQKKESWNTIKPEQEYKMDEEKLIIRLEQIPNGVRLSENYSRRFTECLRKDDMSTSISILHGLVSVIGEINRAYMFGVLYKEMKSVENPLALADGMKTAIFIFSLIFYVLLKRS